MPYILTPLIQESFEPMWNEGQIYEKKNIYKIGKPSQPPVNYDQHNFKPHSMTHIETPAHTEVDGQLMSHYLKNHQNYFYGPTTVLKIKNSQFLKTKDNTYHWSLTSAELQEKISSFSDKIHSKILIAPDVYEVDQFGFHAQNYVFTLSAAAAHMLIEREGFHLFGTSWKSLDYNPERPERPIHDIIFKKAIAMENLDLLNVPEGNYFMCNYPIPVMDASEGVVAPILFTKDEIFNSNI